MTPWEAYELANFCIKAGVMFLMIAVVLSVIANWPKSGGKRG